MTINKVFLGGRLAHDPEVKEVRPGLVKCTLIVITEHMYKNKDGQDMKEVCFTEATVWNKQAERCGASLRKGSLVTVEGRLKQEKWVDKDTGKERNKHVVVPECVLFMEPRATEIKEERFSLDELPF